MQLDAVTVRRSRGLALDDVSFTASTGTLVALIGMSGSGKTSVLRTIAGLDAAAAGAVRIGGRDVGDLAPGERRVAMTFQSPGLIRTRSVSRNIGFPLELRRETARAIAARIGVEARALRIERLLDRDVETLSAGEAQMVQIARALVGTPDVLLLDEPFAAVERGRVQALRHEIQLLQERFGVTTIMATNDPVEAMSIADQVVVLDAGRVVQAAPPLEVYEQPATARAAQLLGPADVSPVTIEVDPDGAWLRHRVVRHRAWQPALRRYEGRRLQLVVRPEWWELDPHGSVAATVRSIRPTATGCEVRAEVDGEHLTFALPGRPRPPAGIEVGSRVGLRLRHWVLLDPLDGRRIDLAS